MRKYHDRKIARRFSLRSAIFTGVLAVIGLGVTPEAAFALPSVTSFTVVPSISFVQNSAITPFSPFVYTGSSGYSPTFFYSISPILPTGLTLNPATGLISGTPAILSASQSYTITATDSTISQDTTSAAFNLAVLSTPTAPSFTYTTTTPAIAESTNVGTAVTSPAISSGGQITSYSWTVADPHFAINTTTGTISVAQPLNYSQTSSYTLQVRGTTALGAFSVATVVISIQNPNVVVTPPAVVPDPVQTSKIDSFTPETATAGSPVEIHVTGTFNRPVSNISLNGSLISPNSWRQSATTLDFPLAALSVGTNIIQIFNGAVPLLNSFSPQAVPTIQLITNGMASHKVKYLHCRNGSQLRIAFGVNPSCPVGYQPAN